MIMKMVDRLYRSSALYCGDFDSPAIYWSEGVDILKTSATLRGVELGGSGFMFVPSFRSTSCKDFLCTS